MVRSLLLFSTILFILNCKGENVDDYDYDETDINDQETSNKYEDKHEDETSYEDMRDEENDDDGSGLGYYEYDYSVSDENQGSAEYYQQYEDAPKYDESELEYIPELTSRPENIYIKPLESATFPCQAQDADKFVRVWLKNGEMLFTANIRLTEDSRFSLSEKNTSLVLVNSTTEDSGVYECRIMVKQSLSVQHRLQVTETFSIKSDPPEGVVMVPIHGATEFGCIVIGGSDSSTLSWSRDNIRFRDGSYSVSGSRFKLENVRLEDSGYYYCTTQDSSGVVKAASVHLQVLSTPVILELSKNVLQSGKGLVLEISCSVKGDPKPKVTWYKNGETILESGRIEIGEAGTRSILIIRGFQDGDYGTYVCYARNLLGNLQQNIQVLQTDRDNIKQTNTRTGGEGLEEVKEGIRILRKSIEKDHKTMLNFRRRIEREIEMIKENQGNLSLPVKQNSFDKAILSDIDRVDTDFRNLNSRFHEFQTEHYSLKRNSEDDRQRIWESVAELQEITNITTRNIEDIYDKDILRLHNFQNTVETEITKLKLDISGVHKNGIEKEGERGEGREEDEILLSFNNVKEELNTIRNMMKSSSNTLHTFRAEINTVFGDIDSFKKEKQDNAIQIEQLKRYVNRLEQEKIEENRAQVYHLSTLLNNLETSVGATAQKIRKVSKQSADDEKLTILVGEVQKMKNQLFFLQQSIIQLRTQEHVNSMVPGSASGVVSVPGGMNPETARIKTDLELLSGKVSGIIDLDCVPREQFSSKFNELVVTVEKQNQALESWRTRLQDAETVNANLISGYNDVVEKLNKVQAEQEKSEQERRKYFLLMKGFKKAGALERQVQLIGMVSNFLKAGLKLQNIKIEEAFRLEDSKGRAPPPIRVKFSSIRNRNLVLSSSRAKRTRIRVQEDFTDRVKENRRRLVEFATKSSSKTRTKWALQEDKLFFNKKIYVYNQTRSQVVPVADIP